MATDPVILANTFLYLAYQKEQSLTEQKVQQLIYSLYKQHLKETGKKLFDEPFWKTEMGPELTSVHNAFCHFWPMDLMEYAKNENGQAEIVDMRVKFPIVKEIKHIWNTYKSIPEYRLRACLTCNKSAWAAANSTLADDAIKAEPMYLDRGLGLDR